MKSNYIYVRMLSWQDEPNSCSSSPRSTRFTWRPKYPLSLSSHLYKRGIDQRRRHTKENTQIHKHKLSSLLVIHKPFAYQEVFISKWRATSFHTFAIVIKVVLCNSWFKWWAASFHTSTIVIKVVLYNSWWNSNKYLVDSRSRWRTWGEEWEDYIFLFKDFIKIVIHTYFSRDSLFSFLWVWFFRKET